VAVVEMLIRLGGDFQVSLLSPLFPSPPILALFIVGPVAMAIDLHRKAAREADTEAGRARATAAS
jgi:hypothetical protein